MAPPIPIHKMFSKLLFYWTREQTHMRTRHHNSGDHDVDVTFYNLHFKTHTPLRPPPPVGWLKGHTSFLWSMCTTAMMEHYTIHVLSCSNVSFVFFFLRETWSISWSGKVGRKSKHCIQSHIVLVDSIKMWLGTNHTMPSQLAQSYHHNTLACFFKIHPLFHVSLHNWKDHLPKGNV